MRHLLALAMLVSVAACKRTPDCGPLFVYDPVNDYCDCAEGTAFVEDAGMCLPTDAGVPGPDGGAPDAGPCTPTTETCNGLDDDCDGVRDGPAASASCGTADHADSLTCTAGECVVTSCVTDYADCDTDASNGCEARLDTLDHCGTCANACGWECDATDCDDAVQIDGGLAFGCVVLESGRVACIGSNEFGQLGNGTSGTGTDRTSWTYVLSPSGTEPFSDAVEVSAGRSHACTRDRIGNVWCWGRNQYRQIGDGTTTDRSLPVRVPEITGAVSVAVGWSQTCAALSTGRVMCWGNNTAGELGSGDTASYVRATEVAGLTNARVVRSEGGATCSILADATVRCWGYNSGYGEAGTGSGEDEVRPAAPLGLGPVRDISLGRQYACAIELDDEVWCWGNHLAGQWGSLLGNDIFPTPQRVTLPIVPVRTFVGRWFVDAEGRIVEGDIPREQRAVEVADIPADSCVRTNAGAVLCRNIGGEFVVSPPP